MCSTMSTYPCDELVKKMDATAGARFAAAARIDAQSQKNDPNYVQLYLRNWSVIDAPPP
jgi:hypothetical protein